MMNLKRGLVVVSIFAFSLPVAAQDLNIQLLTTQNQFRLLSEDLGAAVPSTNIKLYGGELRYAIGPGGIAMPAIGVRGSYTKLTGVDQLDFDTKGVDLSISKGFTIFTPYAGVGKVWVASTPSGNPAL